MNLKNELDVMSTYTDAKGRHKIIFEKKGTLIEKIRSEISCELEKRVLNTT